MQLDKRFRPGGEELGPPTRRRRSSGNGASGGTKAFVVLAVLLLTVLVIGVHVGPTHTSLAWQRRRRLRQRHQHAPGGGGWPDGSTSGGDGSLFAVAARLVSGPIAAGRAAAAGAAERGGVGAGKDDDEALGQSLPTLRPQSAQRQQPESGGTAERTLSFEVCNGFAQQRVALLSGAPCSFVPHDADARTALAEALTALSNDCSCPLVVVLPARLRCPVTRRVERLTPSTALQAWCLRQSSIGAWCCRTCCVMAAGPGSAGIWWILGALTDACLPWENGSAQQEQCPTMEEPRVPCIERFKRAARSRAAGMCTIARPLCRECSARGCGSPLRRRGAPSLCNWAGSSTTCSV